ncbi:hypothetical protein NDU88_003467 [Pleurodeles waltl]|uniref:Uncharacterized protein n=1 Tax=Pleurodeles waltl TaxID=8319 RepID=A0AAV7MSB0_PLEWA|nr:hypothetical protein NDU88_003467 [Pleurodeles waltl]
MLPEKVGLRRPPTSHISHIAYVQKHPLTAAGPPPASFQFVDDEQPGPSWAVSSVYRGHTELDYEEVEEDSLEEEVLREEEAPQMTDETEWWGRDDREGVGGF